MGLLSRARTLYQNLARIRSTPLNPGRSPQDSYVRPFAKRRWASASSPRSLKNDGTANPEFFLHREAAPRYTSTPTDEQPAKGSASFRPRGRNEGTVALRTVRIRPCVRGARPSCAASQGYGSSLCRTLAVSCRYRAP